MKYLIICNPKKKYRREGGTKPIQEMLAHLKIELPFTSPWILSPFGYFPKNHLLWEICPSLGRQNCIGSKCPVLKSVIKNGLQANLDTWTFPETLRLKGKTGQREQKLIYFGKQICCPLLKPFLSFTSLSGTPSLFQYFFFIAHLTLCQFSIELHRDGCHFKAILWSMINTVH